MTVSTNSAWTVGEQKQFSIFFITKIYEINRKLKTIVDVLIF